ncbi:uncharacterized protein LOC119646713 [Hermetia illucens]|uniref:uncharacterized protein LOC119646713 n=1 Tax=Hermetia illucens TaxID=343691 RepID=UPI0018CC7277|nr:uncharacterized protein LOC119646713 [Hermetia illucens]
MDCLSIVLWSLISFVSLIYIYFKKKYSHWKNRGVNYVEPTFPLGNLSFGKTHFKDFSTKIYKQKNEDPFVGAYILAKPIAIATSLDFIQNVLVKDFSNFHERGGYSNEVDDPLSANMLTLDGERWKFLRTKLSPTFTSGKMKLMFSTVVEVANRFSDTLADIVKPEAEVELRDLLARFTTDVIGSCAFGVECNSLKDPNAVFRYYGSKVFEDSAIGPLTHLLAVQYPKLARKLHIRLSRKDVSDFFLKTVRETIDYREKNNVKRNDFMNYLIQLKNGESIDGKDSTERKKLTIEEVTAQAFLFFGAGFETSSTTMTYCLYELALNPDIQERARQEINDVLEKHEDKFTYEALQEMTYVEQIISEALRKYPPIVLLQRKAAQDYQIPNTKIILEKGQEVIIPVYCVHHDPEIYPNPEMFDPSRFAPEQVRSRHPMSFLGFGDGPRNCVGMRFGRMQTRIGLITLLRNYQFKPSSRTAIPLIIDPSVGILTPKGGMNLRVEKIFDTPMKDAKGNCVMNSKDKLEALVQHLAEIFTPNIKELIKLELPPIDSIPNNVWHLKVSFASLNRKLQEMTTNKVLRHDLITGRSTKTSLGQGKYYYVEFVIVSSNPASAKMDWLSIALWSFISIVSIIFLYFKQKYSYWKDRGVNYVEPTFPLGNISLRKEHFRDFLINIYKHKNEDPFVGAYVLAKPVVLPTSLDFIQSILVKDFSIFHERGTYWNEEDDPLSAHMFSVEGEKWKSLRTKLSPTFTSGKMKFMFPAVIEVAHRFNATLADIVKPGTELEIRDFLARFTTDVIGSCAFGIECNSLKDPNSAFRYYGKKIFEDPPLGPALLLLAIQYPDLARKLHVRQMRKEVSDFFLNTVRETIDYREKNNVKRNDFMNFLIQLKNGESIDDESASQTSKLTLEEVAAQAFLFFAAGFETSSTTMTYSLYELALNPDIQDKARQEIKDVLTKHEGQLTYEAVQEMTYIDQIISEALRKYPPVVFLTRRATRDYRIPNTKIIIEKGQDIIIPAYCIHHDPEIYSNPEVFDPNRFTPEEIKSRHPVSFLGFGDGPRNCVGLRFGRMQARIGLVTLLSNYRFKPSPKTAVPLTFDVDIGILTPKGGMYLGVEKI